MGGICVDVDGCVVFDVGGDDVISVSMVCSTGVLGLWVVGFGVESASQPTCQRMLSTHGSQQGRGPWRFAEMANQEMV